MEKISERIQWVINQTGLNKNSFSKAIGLKNNVTIGRIINEDRSPSFEIISKIIQTYGNINARWLLTGYGSPMMNNDENIKNSCINCERLQKLIDSQERHIQRLETDLEEFREKAGKTKEAC